MLDVRPIPQAALDLIKEFEGCKLKPYKCPAGVWTIGYGHTRTTRPEMTITPYEAEMFLQDDLTIVGRAIGRLVTVPLSENEYASLLSFVFNVGGSNFEHSTLLRLLNRGWYDQVPIQLACWTKANGEVLGGLARRRAAEAALWNKKEI